MPTPFGTDPGQDMPGHDHGGMRGLKVVSQATAIATASLDPDDIADATVDALVRVLGARRADLWRMQGGRLVHLRGAGSSSTTPRSDAPPPPVAIFERVTRERAPGWVVADDLAGDEDASGHPESARLTDAPHTWKAVLDDLGCGYLAILPLVANGRALGCLTAALDVGSTALLEELAMFADQVAGATDKARLHRMARDAAHATELQNRVLGDLADCRDLAAVPAVVARHLDDVTFGPAVALAVFDDARAPLVMRADAGGTAHLAHAAERELLDYVAGAGSVVRLDPASPHASPKAMRRIFGADGDASHVAAIALRSHGSVLGVVLAAVSSSDDALGAADFLSTTAPAIAVGLDNAVMFTRKSLRGELLAAANDLAQQVSAATSLDDIHERLVSGVAGTYGPASRAVTYAPVSRLGDQSLQLRASGGQPAGDGSPEEPLVATAAARGAPRRREKGGRTCWAVPLLARGTLHAVLYVEHPTSAVGTFADQDREFLASIAEYAANAMSILGAYADLERNYMSTVQALAGALEATDQYTHDHAQDVAMWAVEVGRRMGLDERELRDLELGAIFHDIGKIAIPSEILNKPAKLTDEEFEVMKTHTVIGERIIAPIEFLEGVRPLVRHEHERWDGRGYPDGISGEDIPLGARIIFVCDAYHAITSDRPYRSAQPHEVARAVLAENAGTQFDPTVVDVFLDVVDAHRPAEGDPGPDEQSEATPKAA